MLQKIIQKLDEIKLELDKTKDNGEIQKQVNKIQDIYSIYRLDQDNILEAIFEKENPKEFFKNYQEQIWKQLIILNRINEICETYSEPAIYYAVMWSD